MRRSPKSYFHCSSSTIIFTACFISPMSATRSIHFILLHLFSPLGNHDLPHCNLRCKAPTITRGPFMLLYRVHLLLPEHKKVSSVSPFVLTQDIRLSFRFYNRLCSFSNFTEQYDYIWQIFFYF